MSKFRFAFDPRFRVQLLAAGITSRTAWVEVTEDALAVQFGPWRLRTSRANIAATQQSGPYRWYRVIGPHLSFADRGVTFGTNVRRGLCVLFHEPVGGLLPFGLLRHPGMTVTVEDVAGLDRELRAGLN